MYNKLIDNIKLNGGKLKAILLKSGTRQRLPTLSLSIQLELLARAIKQVKIKEIQIGKEKLKVLLFADDMIVFISNPKNSTRELLQLINTFSKVVGYKINLKKSVVILYTNDKWTKKEIRETTPFKYPRIKYLGITLTKQTKNLCDSNFNS